MQSWTCLSPFLGAEPFRFVISKQFTYTRCQLQQACLHGGNFSGALQQITKVALQTAKGRRKPAAFVFGVQAGLFGRLLPRRVERAGIVDLRHLVVGEAENLAQDFVGVFAEQWGAGHLAR